MSTARVPALAAQLVEVHLGQVDFLDFTDGESPEQRALWRQLMEATREQYDNHPSKDEQKALHERIRAAVDGDLRADFLKYVDALAMEACITGEAAFALGLALGGVR